MGARCFFLVESSRQKKSWAQSPCSALRRDERTLFLQTEDFFLKFTKGLERCSRTPRSDACLVPKQPGGRRSSRAKTTGGDGDGPLGCESSFKEAVFRWVKRERFLVIFMFFLVSLCFFSGFLECFQCCSMVYSVFLLLAFF